MARVIEDRRLVDRLQLGDPAADLLVQRCGPEAHALSLCILGRPVAAGRATRRASQSIQLQAETFDPTLESVRTWIIGVLHRRAVAERERPADARAATRKAAIDAPEVITFRLERGEPRALSGLTTEQRSMIELMYLGGSSHSEVSGALGIPVKVVRSRCLDGMRSLRGSLLEHGTSRVRVVARWDGVQPA